MEYPGIEVVDSARVSHELSTKNRGRIIESARGNMIGKKGDERHSPGPTFARNRTTRNVSTQPRELVFGPNGDVGVMDPDNNGWTTPDDTWD